MKQTSKKVTAVLAVLVLALSLCSCGKTAQEETKKQRTAMDDVFSGDLIDAQGARLVVKDMDKTLMFSTMGTTNYDLGEESRLSVGDKVKVDYHKIDGMYVANKVSLTEHVDDSLVFGGAVMELEKDFLTVQSESLTVVFNKDDKTQIDGDLSVGDSVTVTYEGNLSANPRAVSVVVILEQKAVEEKNAHGTVSEVDKDSVIVSVDSAHACRFLINKDTVIKGDDTQLKVGDEVQVVYTGNAADKPMAKTITIRRDDKRTYFIMDGVIGDAAKDKIVVRTSKKAYTFKIVEDTRIQNPDYMKAGHKTTITYIGDLDKDPVAASIYCSKDTVTEEEKKNNPDKKEESRKKEEKKQDDKKQDDKKDDDKKDDEKQDDKKDDKKDDAIEIKTKGTIVKWGENPAVFKIEGGATLELDIEDAEITGGYIPQDEDEVVIIYNKETMKLIKMELVYRPVTDRSAAEATEAAQAVEADTQGLANE